MKRIYTTWLLIAGTLLITGCITTNRAPRYMITVAYATGPQEAFPDYTPQGNATSGFVPDDYALPTNAGIRIVTFPRLVLALGEEKQASRQHSVRYPSDFDLKTGKPTRFETRGVGLKVTARINSTSNSRLNVSLAVEDVNEPEWKLQELGHGLPAVSMPSFQSKNITMPALSIAPGSSLVMSGMTHEDETGTNSITYLIRITEK